MEKFYHWQEYNNKINNFFGRKQRYFTQFRELSFCKLSRKIRRKIGEFHFRRKIPSKLGFLRLFPGRRGFGRAVPDGGHFDGLEVGQFDVRIDQVLVDGGA